MKLAKKSLCVALYALAIASTPALAHPPIKGFLAYQARRAGGGDR